nr:gustatory receptor 46 [Papilio dardanus]
MSRRIFRNDKPNNTDFVLDNFLEAEVKPALMPLYVAQWLTLAPKYSLRYDLVTSNGYKFNACIWLCITGILAAWLNYVIDYWTSSGGLLATAVFAYSASVTISFIINSGVTTSKSNKHAHLIILLQRIIKRFNAKVDMKNVTIVNWVYVISIVVFNIVHIACRFADSKGINILKIFTQFVYLSFDCNIVICIRMMSVLGRCIAASLSELECLGLDTELGELRSKSINEDNDRAVAVINVYCQVFKHSIFLMVVVSFFQVLANVQSTITVRVKTLSISTIIAQLVWLKNITLLTLLSLEAENIHLQMKNSQIFCLLLGINCPPDDQFLGSVCRRQCEKAQEWRGAPLPLDAGLPPRFLAELASYTVVILQFHFL